MSTIVANLQAVNRRITTAAELALRPRDAVQLLAVSKTFGADAVIAAAQGGQRAFGENYLQEALDKIDSVKEMHAGLLLEWHFIGPIQSNKTRLIAEHFDWVHTVDREKIAQRLSDQRPAHLPPLNVCLQINISGELSKSGLPPKQALSVAQAVAAMPHLRLRGLMAIPEPQQDLQMQRKSFRDLRELRDRLNMHGLMLDTLSMGMSADLESAIAEGATIVRIGSAIFGQRHYEK